MNNALIIFFNTDFSKNIPALEQIYGPRFSDILYIVPDHSSKLRSDYLNPAIAYKQVNNKDTLINKTRRLSGKKNEHEIVDHSYKEKIERVVGFQYFFQDYFWQARKRILAMDAQWYWFVSDDVLINPSINQGNIHTALERDNSRSLITQPHHPSTEWITWFQASKNVAAEKLQSVNCFADRKPEFAIGFDKNKPGPYEETLVAGCADLFAIHHSKISDFLNYCHQTALKKIFVELAIPNILLCHCYPLAVINDYIWDFSPNRGEWDKVTEFLKTDSYYYHPVKLSILAEEQIKILALSSE